MSLSVSHWRRRRRGVVPYLALLGGLGLTACGTAPTSIQFGLQRQDLNLAFQTAKSGAQPSLAQIAGQPLPIPATSFTLGELPYAQQNFRLGSVPAGLLWSCPAAPTGSVPAEAANPFITTAPAAGVYFQHNRGTAKLAAATVTLLSLPYPHHTSMEIEHVKITPQTSYSGLQATTTHLITYDLVEKNPLETVTTSYQVTSSELDLTKTVTQSSLGTLTFSPTPAITLMQFKGVGASWTSAGIDPSTDTVMVVQGQISKEQAMDVCGTMIDTYQVISNEEVTNPLGNFTETTNKSDPNVYDIATDLGGLMVSQHIDTQTTFTVNKTPYTLTQDYDSTVDSVNPHPHGTAPPPPYP